VELCTTDSNKDINTLLGLYANTLLYANTGVIENEKESYC